MVQVAGWFQNAMKLTRDESLLRDIGERDAGQHETGGMTPGRVMPVHAKWR
jgi:hypothetical protein